MADVAITELPEADYPIGAGQRLVIVQDGVTKYTTAGKLVKSMLGALGGDIDDDTWGVRSWGVFNGTGAVGFKTPDRAKGVESIEKTGTGLYEVILVDDVVDALGDPDYHVSVTATSTGAEMGTAKSGTSRKFYIYVRNVTTGALADASYISFAIVGG